MIDSNILSLFNVRYRSLTVNGHGDDYSNATRCMTLGLVVNTDDPLQQGRLQVFCPALNDNPKKIMHLPWCAYIPPFGGSINSENFTRGTGDGKSTSKGAVHYGFWGVPELGAHVLVGCIDGDPRRRFFSGSLPEHQETHTMFNGRFDWSSKKGTPDGPLTSEKEPIQPIYDNWTLAFADDRKAREWKTRGADYQVTANPDDGNGNPSEVKGEDYLDQSYEGMSKAEKDEWVKEILGSHGYDWSGFKNVGPFKSSRVFGFSTPGFHSFSMDDRPFNSRMKFRTATGHQVILDDTNERIYVMTNKGNSWMEMDSSGNIDVFGDRRISLSASKDINISAGGTIRLHGERGVYIYGGHTEEGNAPLENPPIDGEVRIQSAVDMHLLANNLRTKAHQNTYSETGINSYTTVGDSTFTDVQKDINVRTLSGDIITSAAQDLFETVERNSKRMAMGTSAFTSQGNNEIYSFEGNLSVGAKEDATFKSSKGNVDIEAMGQGTDAGNVRVNSPRSQVTIGDEGIAGLTSKSANIKAAENIELEISETKAGSKSGGVGATIVNIDGLPDLGDCDIGPQTPVTGYNPNTPMPLSDVAKICYNAGFRGDDLITAVALAGGESSYRPNPTPPANPDTSGKWGPAIGLFQIRTLNDCAPYANTVDGLRNNSNGQLEDPNVNAKVAFQIFSKCNPPNEWTVGKWESFKSDRIDDNFTAFVEDAAAAVADMCGVPLMLSPMGVSISYTETEVCCEGDTHDHEEMLFGASAAAAGTTFLMSAEKMVLQSAQDIAFKALVTGDYNAYSEIVGKLNQNILQTDLLSYYTKILTDKVDDLADAVGESFSIPLSIDAASLISSIYSGGFPSALTNLFGDIAGLNAAISTLGGLGLSLPLTMENIVGQLAGNTAVLAALGLPTSLSFPINPAAIGSLDILDVLTDAIDSIDIPLLAIPPFRQLVDKIFINATYPLGDVGLDPADWDSFGGIFDVV